MSTMNRFIGIGVLLVGSGVETGGNESKNGGVWRGFETYSRRIKTDQTDQARPSRTLGLVVLRGPNIALISPTDGSAGKFSFCSIDLTRD